MAKETKKVVGIGSTGRYQFGFGGLPILTRLRVKGAVYGTIFRIFAELNSGLTVYTMRAVGRLRGAFEGP